MQTTSIHAISELLSKEAVGPVEIVIEPLPKYRINEPRNARVTVNGKVTYVSSPHSPRRLIGNLLSANSQRASINGESLAEQGRQRNGETTHFISDPDLDTMPEIPNRPLELTVKHVPKRNSVILTPGELAFACKWDHGMEDRAMPYISIPHPSRQAAHWHQNVVAQVNPVITLSSDLAFRSRLESVGLDTPTLTPVPEAKDEIVKQAEQQVMATCSKILEHTGIRPERSRSFQDAAGTHPAWTIGESSQRISVHPDAHPVAIDEQKLPQAFQATLARALLRYEAGMTVPVLPPNWSHDQMPTATIAEIRAVLDDGSTVTLEDPGFADRLPAMAADLSLLVRITHPGGRVEELTVPADIIVTDDDYTLHLSRSSTLTPDEVVGLMTSIRAANAVRDGESTDDHLVDLWAQEFNAAATRALLGEQQGFLAELQALADNFYHQSRAPEAPVTVSNARHRITWEPVKPDDKET